MKPIWLLFLCFAAPSYSECLAEVSLHAGINSVSYKVEVEAEEADRARGMMGRRTLANDAGMLFLYPQAGTRNFWMKDTLIALDILFFNQKLELANVSKNAIPNDETPLFGGDDIVAVLEINAGQFAKLGFKDQVTLHVQNIMGETCPNWVLENERF